MNSLRLVDGSGVGAEWCVLRLLMAAELARNGVCLGRLKSIESMRNGAGALILVPFSCLWGHSRCSAGMPAKSRLPAVEAERLEIREVNRDSEFV